MEGHEVRCAEEASSEDVAEPSDGVRVVQLLLEEHHGDPRHAAGAAAQTPISMDYVCTSPARVSCRTM